MLENRSTFTGVEQAITRDNPFSALGTNTEGLMTSRDCIESANLDWKVELMPAYAKLPSGKFVENSRAFFFDLKILAVPPIPRIGCSST